MQMHTSCAACPMVTLAASQTRRFEIFKEVVEKEENFTAEVVGQIFKEVRPHGWLLQPACLLAALPYCPHIQEGAMGRTRAANGWAPSEVGDKCSTGMA
eukprot:366125-Chlamydomonas_euryale.AAC.1